MTAMKSANRKAVQDNNFGKVRSKKKVLNTVNESPQEQSVLGNKKRFTEHDMCTLKPMNTRQEEFLRLFYEGSEVMVASGAAGTGKSFLAMYCAISEVVRNDSPVDKIILVRSPVQTRDVGFLSGNEDKFSFYEAPYGSICSDILFRYKDAYNHLKSLGTLEFHLTSFIRGTTFDNAIIIFDEFQSANYHEIASVITRAGHNSRVILCGDSKQDDLAGKGRKNDQSGFAKAMTVINKMPANMVGCVEYKIEDIVRSGLVKEFLLADYYTS